MVEPGDLNAILVPDCSEFRENATEFLKSHEIFQVTDEEFEYDMARQRELALLRVRKFVSSGLVSVHDIIDNPRKFIATHEVLGCVDPGLVYFFSVHFNLFGGTVLKLGSNRHHEQYLGDIDSMNMIGCFALTELRHGVNSGFNMDTTATYIPEDDEFEIDTPSPVAQKTWISFSAVQANASVVFARLMVGEKDEGVHAFFLRIRDDNGNVVDGVRIEDVGHKPSLNSNDNGRIFFDRVRVPRENLLDRYCKVDSQGNYSSEIVKPRNRFLKVSDQLSSGRMCIGAAALLISKLSVICALRYSITREQTRFIGNMKLYEHLSQKLALLPLLAECYALSITVDYVKSRYCSKDRQKSLDLVYGFKSYASRQATMAAHICVEKCGGQGLISNNRLSEWEGIAAGLMVVEGDAMILAQKAAKGILDKLKKRGLVKSWFLGLFEGLGLRFSSYFLSSVRDPGFPLTLFKLREHILTWQLGAKIRQSTSSGIHLLDAWSKIHLDVVMMLHQAHMERIIYQKFQEAIRKCSKSDVKTDLSCLCRLWALSRIKHDLGWFVSNTNLTAQSARQVSQEINLICQQIKEEDTLNFLNGFGIPDELITSPIANRDLWIKAME